MTGSRDLLSRLRAAWADGFAWFRSGLLPASSGRSAQVGWTTNTRSRAQAFADHRTRRNRYEFHRAFAQNVAYVDELCRFAPQVRGQFGTTKTIRPIKNPTGRIVQFWQDHMYIGSRDPDMGDGRKVPTSLPLRAKSEAARKGIARICRDGRWDLQAPLYPYIGSMLGDVVLFCNADPRTETVGVEVAEPDGLAEYEVDAWGEPTHYLWSEWVDDPRPATTTDVARGYRTQVLYVEQGDLVLDGRGRPVRARFQTFLQDDAGIDRHEWVSGQGDDWEDEYPHLPVVLVPHLRVIPRCPFGGSETATAIAKIVENDDVNSRYHTFIRKSVDPVVMFSGVEDPERRIKTADADNTLRAIYANNPGANARMLLAALDLAAMNGRTDQLDREIEKDFPELQEPVYHAKGDTSGKALRLFLQGMATKGRTRRVGYDAGLCSAWRRCLVMGGALGFRGYEDFTPEKLAADDELLDFSIMDRDVYAPDELDRLDVALKRWQVIESGERAGAVVTDMMRLTGYDEDDIRMIEKGRDEQIALGRPVGRQVQAQAQDPNTADANQAPGKTVQPRQDANARQGAAAG
jgi:hypothetical protein